MLLNAEYFLLPEQERDIIVHAETGLRINVFSLENEGFISTPGELHIFGDDHGEWLAFETEGWTWEAQSVFSKAVLWYAVILDYPQMEVTTEDPRPGFRLRVV